MYVKIGPYTKWWGPYQIADLLQKIGLSEARCQKIGEKLSNIKWLVNLWWKQDKLKQNETIYLSNYQ